MLLYIANNHIERVMYPITAPAESAQAMLALLER